MRKPRPSDTYFGPTESRDSATAAPPEDEVEETGPDGISVEFLTEAL